MYPSVLILKVWGFFLGLSVSQKFALYFHMYKAIYQEGREA